MAKRKSRLQEWETIHGDSGGNRFVALPFTVLESPSFKSLPNRAKLLYEYMKKKGWTGDKKRAPPFRDMPSIPEKNRCRVFYFTGNDAAESGLYTANYAKPFKSDKDALISHGFIDDLAPDITRGNGIAKIFMFSDRWKTWKPGGK